MVELRVVTCRDVLETDFVLISKRRDICKQQIGARSDARHLLFFYMNCMLKRAKI